ncbi:hypothetical protein P7C73_g3512, partial [Tremellales sp. Uapishka_1]
MSSNPTVPILATILIPVSTFLSFSIYLSSHPSSPVNKLLAKPIALPTTRGEALDGIADTEHDPFDISDPEVLHDGTPVEPEKFWAKTWRRKIALLITLLLPFIANILLLVFTILDDLPSGDEKTRRIAVPSLLLPSHLVTLLMAYWYLSQSLTTTHWPTTIHLSTIIFMQFLVLSFLALLPSSPIAQVPSFLLATFARADLFRLPSMKPLDVLPPLLAILEIPPLLVVLSIRRGPALYLPLSVIYPPKIIDAIPLDSVALDSTKPNLTEEIQCTVWDWLIFSYATKVVRKGHEMETMEVWDLPVLAAPMRALTAYKKVKKVYGNPRHRLGKMEGYNLLWKLAKVNAGMLWAQTILAAITAFGYYLPPYLLQNFIYYLETDPTRSHPAWGWFLAFALFFSNAVMNIAQGILWAIDVTYLTARIRSQLNTLLFSKTLRKKDIASTGEDSSKVGGVKEEKAKDKKRKESGEEKNEDEDNEGVTSKSQIMTLFTVDVDRVTEFVMHAFTIVDAPLEIVVATFFLFRLLGVSALFGLLTTILCAPLNHIASKFVVTAQENLMKTRDERTALMNEVLQGIRMLKFMAWERSFEKRIKAIRRNELSWQARNYQIEVAFNIIWALTPVLVTVVSFIHFTLVRGEKLTPSIAFTSVAVFSELRFALNALPETFIQALQGFVSCRRIEKYMTLAEVSTVDEYVGDGDITLTSATLTWPRDSATVTAPSTAAPTPRNGFTLADINLKFPQGQLSLICGRLGSGKTLLLSGLLGEADLLTGQINCPRSSPDAMSAFGEKVLEQDWILQNMTGYVPQQAWLQNASIRDNIVFSSPWNKRRYEQVIEACSLTTDLQILEDGDETEIGEKGLNLSGGQKARVSLARAIYSRAGVLFLDDVLSAVDAHTAHAIMENCLQGPLVHGRTILLVSHHTALVSPAAAYIVALENGDIKFSGTRADFVECGLMGELDAEEKTKEEKEDEREEKAIEELAKSKPGHKSIVSIANTDASGSNSETSSLASGDEEETATESVDDVKAKAPRKLIEDEKRARGRIAWAVWKTYFGVCHFRRGACEWLTYFPIRPWVGTSGVHAFLYEGVLVSVADPPAGFTFLVVIFVGTFVPVAENGWLQYWSGSYLNDQETVHPTAFYIVGYGLITMLGVFVVNSRFGIMYYGSLQASSKLHDAMLESVLFATLRFHDTTNRGRLLNRFGKDIEGLDSATADHFVRSLGYGLQVIVTFVSITYVGGLPFFVAACLITYVYYAAGSIYGQTSRDMRRLDSVTRSPLYSLFGETVSGVAVIRSFGASTIALKHMMKCSDTNLLAYVWSWTVNRWLSARYNLLSAVTIGVTAVAILIAPGVTAAKAGFALSFAGTISNNILFVVRRFVQLEQSMVALERIKEYTELKREAPEFVEPRPPALWPDAGAISVEKLVIRYAADLPNVLHGISFEVAPREKIGIVGSTGCGKSTLAMSFFRFVEAAEGRIVIDGRDISNVGLTDLRSRVTIIPQDPTILSGSLRSTLDVFDEYDDADIYAALRRVHLLKDDDSTATVGESFDINEDENRNKNVFKDLSNPVSEGGDNFSSGEKQLICMARAILRRNRVLFMDEATASIDYETDELISKTIREEFSDSTILTIAHRIHTIIDFDKVLVMDRGQVSEYASPAELLRDHKSKFYALCKATGRMEFKNLKEMAVAAERKRTKSS